MDHRNGGKRYKGRRLSYILYESSAKTMADGLSAMDFLKKP
ncbi:MAG: hypothetical protein ACTHMI_01760 [Mucilaginibacter sp.]